MTHESAIELQGFERIDASPGTALLRVTGTHAGTKKKRRPLTLVIDDGSQLHRLAPLPAPPDSGDMLRVAFSAPVALLGGRTAFALDLGRGEIVDLPAPTSGNQRLVQGASARVPRSGKLRRAEDLAERQRLDEAERRADARRHAITELERRLQAEQDRRAEAEQRQAQIDAEHQQALALISDLEAQEQAAASARDELDAELTRGAEALAALEQAVHERDSELTLAEAELAERLAALERSHEATAQAHQETARLRGNRNRAPSPPARGRQFRSGLAPRLQPPGFDDNRPHFPGRLPGGHCPG